jgi:hypothetical protein
VIVLAPYSELRHPEAHSALLSHAPQAIAVDTSATVYDYWNALSQRWTGEDDLLVIEHDIEITFDTIPSFANCSQPWCTYWYHWCPAMRVMDSLGCTRFSAALQKAVPMPAIQVAWYEIDAVVSTRLKSLDYSAHVHGEVKHYHEYEHIWLDPPGKVRRWTWRQRQGYYPNIDNAWTGPVIPENAEIEIRNTANMFGT